MTDSFGASDLDNDMPGMGVGPQPGNARGAPSQLQALVQHFMGQSQGRPNPKFLPPPPGQGGQQRKPPPMPSTDPPDPGARNMAPAPSGFPRPPPQFTPYIQPIPRDHTLWGQPEPYARLPQSFELGGMYSQLGNYFAQHGSFATGPLGAGTAAYAKAYQDAYQKGMEWKMRLAKAQLDAHRDQLFDLEQARTTEYADIFTRHSIEGTDPHDDLWAKAVEHGDKDVIAMMENGDSAEKVRRFLADHEAHIRALGAANTKASADDDDAALYGLKPKGQGGDAYDPYTNPTGVHGGAAPAGGAAPVAPGEVAGPGAPSGDDRAKGVGPPKEGDETKPSADDTPSIFKGVNPELASAASDMYRGEQPTGMGKTALHATRMLAERMAQEADAISRDPNLKPGQYLDAVRKRLGPRIADDMQGMEEYRTAPGSASGYGKQGDYLRGIENIVRKDMPNDANGMGGWNAAYYHDRDVFRNGPALQNTIGRISTVSTTGAQLMAAVNNLPDQSAGAMQRMWDAFQNGTLNDPRYVAVFNAWQRYNQEINVIIRGGAGGITETESAVANVKPWGGPAAYRVAIKQDAENALVRARQLHKRWDQIGGGKMPGIDESSELGLDILSKINPADGAITGPDGVKREYLGVNPIDPMARENWEIIP